jgi:hypothetical protein
VCSTASISITTYQAVVTFLLTKILLLAAKKVLLLSLPKGHLQPNTNGLLTSCLLQEGAFEMF